MLVPGSRRSGSARLAQPVPPAASPANACALGPRDYGCDPKDTHLAIPAMADRFRLAVQSESATMHSPNHGRFLLDFSPARRGYFFAPARAMPSGYSRKCRIARSFGGAWAAAVEPGAYWRLLSLRLGRGKTAIEVVSWTMPRDTSPASPTCA